MNFTARKPNQANCYYSVMYRYKKDVGFIHLLVPLSRSRITSSSRTSNANTHAEYDSKRHHYETMQHRHIIPRVAFTIAIIDEDSKLRVLTVKSSVVNANYVYASLAALQQRMQPTAAKLIIICHISFTLF